MRFGNESGWDGKPQAVESKRHVWRACNSHKLVVRGDVGGFGAGSVDLQSSNCWHCGVSVPCLRAALPHKAVPVSKLESGAHLPASELAEAERKLG